MVCRIINLLDIFGQADRVAKKGSGGQKSRTGEQFILLLLVDIINKINVVNWLMLWLI